MIGIDHTVFMDFVYIPPVADKDDLSQLTGTFYHGYASPVISILSTLYFVPLCPSVVASSTRLCPSTPSIVISIRLPTPPGKHNHHRNHTGKTLLTIIVNPHALPLPNPNARAKDSRVNGVSEVEREPDRGSVDAYWSTEGPEQSKYRESSCFPRCMKPERGAGQGCGRQ